MSSENRNLDAAASETPEILTTSTMALQVSEKEATGAVDLPISESITSDIKASNESEHKVTDDADLKISKSLASEIMVPSESGNEASGATDLPICKSVTSDIQAPKDGQDEAIDVAGLEAPKSLASEVTALEQITDKHERIESLMRALKELGGRYVRVKAEHASYESAYMKITSMIIEADESFRRTLIPTRVSLQNINRAFLQRDEVLAKEGRVLTGERQAEERQEATAQRLTRNELSRLKVNETKTIIRIQDDGSYSGLLIRREKSSQDEAIRPSPETPLGHITQRTSLVLESDSASNSPAKTPSTVHKVEASPIKKDLGPRSRAVAKFQYKSPEERAKFAPLDPESLSLVQGTSPNPGEPRSVVRTPKSEKNVARRLCIRRSELPSGVNPLKWMNDRLPSQGVEAINWSKKTQRLFIDFLTNEGAQQYIAWAQSDPVMRCYDSDAAQVLVQWGERQPVMSKDTLRIINNHPQHTRRLTVTVKPSSLVELRKLIKPDWLIEAPIQDKKGETTTLRYNFKTISWTIQAREILEKSPMNNGSELIRVDPESGEGPQNPELARDENQGQTQCMTSVRENTTPTTSQTEILDQGHGQSGKETRSSSKIAPKPFRYLKRGSFKAAKTRLDVSVVQVTCPTILDATLLWLSNNLLFGRILEIYCNVTRGTIIFGDSDQASRCIQLLKTDSDFCVSCPESLEFLTSSRILHDTWVCREGASRTVIGRLSTSAQAQFLECVLPAIERMPECILFSWGFLSEFRVCFCFTSIAVACLVMDNSKVRWSIIAQQFESLEFGPDPAQCTKEELASIPVTEYCHPTAGPGDVVLASRVAYLLEKQLPNATFTKSNPLAEEFIPGSSLGQSSSEAVPDIIRYGGRWEEASNIKTPSPQVVVPECPPSSEPLHLDTVVPPAVVLFDGSTTPANQSVTAPSSLVVPSECPSIPPTQSVLADEPFAVENREDDKPSECPSMPLPQSAPGDEPLAMENREDDKSSDCPSILTIQSAQADGPLTVENQQNVEDSAIKMTISNA